MLIPASTVEVFRDICAVGAGTGTEYPTGSKFPLPISTVGVPFINTVERSSAASAVSLPKPYKAGGRTKEPF